MLENAAALEKEKKLIEKAIEKTNSQIREVQVAIDHEKETIKALEGERSNLQQKVLITLLVHSLYSYTLRSWNSPRWK